MPTEPNVDVPLIDHHCQQLQFVLLSSDARVLQWAAERTIAHQASILRLTDKVDDPAIELDATVELAIDPLRL